MTPLVWRSCSAVAASLILAGCGNGGAAADNATGVTVSFNDASGGQEASNDTVSDIDLSGGETNPPRSGSSFHSDDRLIRGTLADWAGASDGERTRAAVTMATRLQRDATTAVYIQSCVDEVAVDPSLGSQMVDEVAAACMAMPQAPK
jgi:hypothetical protein